MAKRKNDPTPGAPAVSASGSSVEEANAAPDADGADGEAPTEAIAVPAQDEPLVVPEAEPVSAPEPTMSRSPSWVPDTHVLATWTGLGRFSGVLYTLEGKERPFCIGVTVGYFPLASVVKMKAQFQRPDDAAPLPSTVAPLAGPVPEGHVLARWKGPGRFSGRHFTFPAREERPFCVGATTAYFDAASVKKLAGHFETL